MKLFYLFFLSALLASGPAFAGLRGDWQSAGSPIPPYDPPYKFVYHCQAELTDGELLRGQGGEIALGRPYILYAVQKFDLDRAKPHSSLNANWVWIAKMQDAESNASSEIEFKSVPQGAFSLSGHFAGISMERGSRPSEDRVTLSATVKLSFDDYYMASTERETTTRAARSIDVRAVAYLHREEGQPESLPRSKQRSLYVICDKGR